MNGRIAAAVGVAVLGAATFAVVDAQSDEQPCEATRSGDIVTIDLSTCEVTPSTLPPATSSTTTTSTTVPPTTTEPPATTTTAPATTSSTAAPTTSSTSSTTSTTQPQDGSPSFLATFSSPADFYDRFVTDVHHREGDTTPSATWSGDHDMACGSPNTQRTVHGGIEAELFWWCAPAGPDTGHVMTSMGEMAGYSIVGFAPDRTFSNVESVCFDINLTDLKGSNWFEVWMIPEAIYQANGRTMAYVSTGAEGIDAGAHRLEAGMVAIAGTYGPSLWLGRTKVAEVGGGFHAGTDKATRFTHCMTDNGNGTVTLTEEHRDGQVGSSTGGGSFPNGPMRVLFKTHTYTPVKHGDPTGTWHWDNIAITEG